RPRLRRRLALAPGRAGETPARRTGGGFLGIARGVGEDRGAGPGLSARWEQRAIRHHRGWYARYHALPPRNRLPKPDQRAAWRPTASRITASPPATCSSPRARVIAV